MRRWGTTNTRPTRSTCVSQTFAAFKAMSNVDQLTSIASPHKGVFHDVFITHDTLDMAAKCHRRSKPRRTGGLRRAAPACTGCA